MVKALTKSVRRLLLWFAAAGFLAGCGQPGTPARVALAWDQPVDFDLELWDAEGKAPLVQAFTFCGEDITNGAAGTEFFLFQKHDDHHDYSTGTYRVQALLTPLVSDAAPVRATLTVTLPDGATREVARTFPPGAAVSQWVILNLNAATGAVEVLDRVK